MAYLEICEVTKRFPGGVVAVDHISLSVEKGEIRAILGENGAGKTTLMKYPGRFSPAPAAFIDFNSGGKKNQGAIPDESGTDPKIHSKECFNRGSRFGKFRWLFWTGIKIFRLRLHYF
jgi:ABC-type uncharacterized transport system ATPase subunit